VNLYRFALLEAADEKEREKIEQALQPPITAKRRGVPTWYGSDEDAEAEWLRASRR